MKAFAELFDKVVPLRVAAGQFVDHPALVERSQQARNELRAATFEVFAPEFAALSEQAREQLADAIGAALSLDAWIVLRRRDGLSLERAVAVWRLTLDRPAGAGGRRRRANKLSPWSPIDFAFAIRDLRAPKRNPAAPYMATSQLHEDFSRARSTSRRAPTAVSVSFSRASLP